MRAAGVALTTWGGCWTRAARLVAPSEPDSSDELEEELDERVDKATGGAKSREKAFLAEIEELQKKLQSSGASDGTPTENVDLVRAILLRATFEGAIAKGRALDRANRLNALILSMVRCKIRPSSCHPL